MTGVQTCALPIYIDCGEGKDYATKQEAATALSKFLEDSGLGHIGTPWIISSGGGLHVYFPFEEDVTVATWKPVAENLKRLAKKLGFNIDASVTGDAARILRVPDTHNYKQEKPRKVVIKVEGGVFDFEALADHLRTAVGEESYDAVMALNLPGQRPKEKPNANSVKLMENSATY